MKKQEFYDRWEEALMQGLAKEGALITDGHMITNAFESRRRKLNEELDAA